MNESGPLDPDQTQEWIDRERDRLKGEREANGQQPRSDAWIQALREWLKQLQPGATSAFAGLGQDELSRTLQGFGAAQQSIMEALAKIPPLGLAGSHFQLWNQLQAADAEYRKVEERFRESLIDVHLQTLDELERRLKSRKGAPANERELFDLWIECGEAIFSKTAHSAEFARLQGSMSNAAVHRVRAQKAVLEQIARMYDMPTRSELNSVHEQLRMLRRELEAMKRGSAAKSSPKQKPKPSNRAAKVSKAKSSKRKVSR